LYTGVQKYKFPSHLQRSLCSAVNVGLPAVARVSTNLAQPISRRIPERIEDTIFLKIPEDFYTTSHTISKCT